jgi:pimeloyl-ACP methyl ester carboxylesterase
VAVDDLAHLHAVRAALGHERIVCYGALYGAQLGQHVMRDFPGMLQAVVLDGASPLSRKSWVQSKALDVDYSIRHLSALREADPKCRAACDVPALIERAMKLFDEGPIPASHTDPKEPGTTLKFDIRQSDLAALIYGMQGSKVGVMALPLTLENLVDNGRASIASELGAIIGQKLLALRSAPAGSMATIMHLAVWFARMTRCARWMNWCSTGQAAMRPCSVLAKRGSACACAARSVCRPRQPAAH